MEDNQKYGCNLSEEEKKEIEKDMEKRMHRNGVIGSIIEFFVLILTVLVIFFPDVLTYICHMVSSVTICWGRTS